MNRGPLAILIIAALPAFTPRCLSPPPLVTGDVPTANKETFEWYLGARYQESESGNPTRLLPFTDLIRDCTVTVGSFLGAWLWSISPQANFIGAAICGAFGTIGFWRFINRAAQTYLSTGRLSP